MIATTRMRCDQTTIEYVEKRRAEGKTRREIIRCLKRHIARQVYRLLTDPPSTPDGADLRCLRQKTRTTLAQARHSRPCPPNAYLATGTRPLPQPSTRHPIPNMARPPEPDLQNIGASTPRKTTPTRLTEPNKNPDPETIWRT